MESARRLLLGDGYLSGHVDLDSYTEGIRNVDLHNVSVLVYKARFGLTDANKRDIPSIRLFQFQQGALVQWSLSLAALILHALAIFEPPAEIPVNPYYLLIIEFVCMVLFALDIVGKFKYLVPGRWLTDKKIPMLSVVLVVTLLDMLIFVLVRIIVGPAAYPIRISRLLRPLFVCYLSKPLRVAMRDLRNTLPEISDIVSFVLLVVVFFAILVQILYDKTEQGDQYFSDFGHSLTSMYVLLTTANYPDVMMPSYRESRWNALVFVSYLTLVLFILLNYVLAVIYNKYRGYLRKEMIKLEKIRDHNMKQAFSILDPANSGEMSRRRFFAFLDVHKPHYKKEKKRLLWDLLSSDGRCITMASWINLTDVLNTKITPRSKAQHCFSCMNIPRTWITRIQEFVRRPYFDYVVMLTMAAQAAITVYLEGSLHEQRSDDVIVVQLGFSFLFILEICFKVFSLGWQEFVSRGWNKVDLAILVLSILDVLLFIVALSTPPSSALWRVALVLRVVRLVSFFGKIPRYRRYIGTLLELSPLLGTCLGMQLITFYVYSMVGMSLFSDTLDPSNAAVAGSDFGKANYYANNFDTFPAAMVTLFELLVVNNWHVIVSGFVAATSRWAWLFFILFHITAVIVNLNIIIAFVLEAYVLQLDRRERAAGHLQPELHAKLMSLKHSSSQRRSRQRSYSTNSVDSGGQSDDEPLQDIANEPNPSEYWHVRKKYFTNYFITTIFEGEFRVPEGQNSAPSTVPDY